MDAATATVTASSKAGETAWINNNVLLTFSSKDNESGISELDIFTLKLGAEYYCK